METAQHVDIYASARREKCNELALVLESQSIPSNIRRDGRLWVLGVDAAYVAAARREIGAYAAESRHRAPGDHTIPVVGNAWPGIFVYIVAIFGMSLLAPDMRFGVDWLAAGRMDAARMLSGDWWRPITALTLHADAAHLLGNAFFGSLFAYSIARYWGGGFGWLAILTSGALANVANGVLSGPDHRSIGASTAVFAALGLLSAYGWRRGFPSWVSFRERAAPVVAGIGLLAYTGTGGVDTDIGAHLLGFAAGFLGGLLVSRFGFPRGRRAQVGAGISAGAIAVAAWVAALV